MNEAVEELLSRQLRAWPLLASGVAGLRGARTRALEVDGKSVLVRHIPHRVASTTAAVDRESIARRPCFLCAANMPPEEEGLPFGPDFTIYCNPFPVVEKHLTVVHREHRPQRIADGLGALLDLAAALPGFFAVYNGPECGASAPDHLHLQAGELGELPVARDAADAAGPALAGYGWKALLLRGDRPGVEAQTRAALARLASVTGRVPEPLVNLTAFGDPRRGFTVVLFPRAKHRPAAFHTGELTVSPAALDMSGILVVPFEKDFERLSGPAVAAVFREVSLPDEPFREVLSRLGRA